MNASVSPRILVTGTAGFIGYHLADRLIRDGIEVVGLDNINDYYDVGLKYARLDRHGIDGQALGKNLAVTSDTHPNYTFVRADLANHDFVVPFVRDGKFDFVIHLAAQAGVRYSIEEPWTYLRSNVDGFLSILEGCRDSGLRHLVYASTSSIYGLNSSLPLSEGTPAEHPLALYAATKKANEMMAHAYSHLFGIPTTGLRFFTVYGPWGRPDMALFLFVEAILRGESIKVFNEGNMIRDLTYIDDVVESLLRLIFKPPKPDPDWDANQPDSGTSSAPWQVFNIGNSKPVELMDLIAAIETALGIKARKEWLPMQAGDMPATHSDVSRLAEYVGFRPDTSIERGVKAFVDWYQDYRSRTKEE